MRAQTPLPAGAGLPPTVAALPGGETKSVPTVSSPASEASVGGGAEPCEAEGVGEVAGRESGIAGRST